MGKRDKKTIRRRFLPFTLMEMLIVLMIVLLASAAIGINVSKAIRQERFGTATRLILDKLQLAQNMMLILHTDVKVKISEGVDDKNSLRCWIVVDNPLTLSLKSVLNHNPEIKGITNAAFEDMHSQEKKELPITLEFLAGGSFMSRGTLHLYDSKDKSMEEIIELPGYPQAIGHSAKALQRKREDKYEEHNDILFPKEVKKILEETAAAFPAA